MSVLSDMEWMGAHAHLFDYHTDDAQRFHRELMGWWSSMQGGEVRAAELWRHFQRLSSSGPVEAVCGLSIRSYMDRKLYTDRMRRGEALNRQLWQVPCAAITPRCGEAVYLPQQQCFAGALQDPAQRKKAVEAIIAQSAQKAERLVNELNKLTDDQQATDAKLLYPTLQGKGGFRLWKGAISLLFTVLGFGLLPLWLEIVWEMADVLFFISFMDFSYAVDRALQSLWYLEPIQLAIFLVGVPWAIFGWKQSLWEMWFALYRRCALWALAVRNRRRRAHTQRMKQRILQTAQQLRTNNRPWRAAAKPALAGFAAQMPAWVQVGKNPRLRVKEPHWLQGSFCIYPKEGPGKRKNASLHGALVLLQAVACTVLAQVADWQLYLMR